MDDKSRESFEERSRALFQDSVEYRDLALTPIGDEDALELLTVTEVARRAARAKLRPLQGAPEALGES